MKVTTLYTLRKSQIYRDSLSTLKAKHDKWSTLLGNCILLVSIWSKDPNLYPHIILILLGCFFNLL